jgi:hypothetical protein
MFLLGVDLKSGSNLLSSLLDPSNLVMAATRLAGVATAPLPVASGLDTHKERKGTAKAKTILTMPPIIKTNTPSSRCPNSTSLRIVFLALLTDFAALPVTARLLQTPTCSQRPRPGYQISTSSQVVLLMRLSFFRFVFDGLCVANRLRYEYSCLAIITDSFDLLLMK